MAGLWQCYTYINMIIHYPTLCCWLNPNNFNSISESISMLIDFGTFPSLWQWLYHGKNPTKIAMEKHRHPRLLPRIRSWLWRTHCRGLGGARERSFGFEVFSSKKGEVPTIWHIFTIKKMDWTNPFFLIWTSRWSIEASNIGYKINFQVVSQINRCQNEGLISPQSMAIELFKGSFGPSLGIRILAILGSETNPVEISKMGNMWKEHREFTWINSKYPKIIQWLSTRSSSSLPQKKSKEWKSTSRMTRPCFPMTSLVFLFHQ